MAEVVIASGPFYVNCNPGPSEACWVMANSGNWHLWSGPVEGISRTVESEQLWGQQMQT